MSLASRDEFKILSEVEAIHLPTGTVFRAYPYSDPDHMLQSIVVQVRGPAAISSKGHSAEQLRQVAEQLFLEQVRRVMRTAA
jgi:hypothetical protein